MCISPGRLIVALPAIVQLMGWERRDLTGGIVNRSDHRSPLIVLAFAGVVTRLRSALGVVDQASRAAIANTRWPF